MESLEQRRVLAALVGVDFGSGANSPDNWTSIGSGVTPFTRSNLVDETGGATAFDLEITGSGFDGQFEASNVAPAAPTIPSHTQSLAGLDGNISTSNNLIEFTWSGLDSSEDYEVYVFGLHDGFFGDQRHSITIAGAGLPISFDQVLDGNELYVNEVIGSSGQDLGDNAEVLRPDGEGRIVVSVDRGEVLSNDVSIAGLAIRQINGSNGTGADLTLNVTNSDLEENGAETTATVSRNVAGNTPLTVTLESSDTTEATVPVSVVIPAGQLTSPSFDITPVDDSDVDGTQQVTITASGTGHSNGTATIEVADDEVSPQLTVTLTDSEISENGGMTRATVTRNTNESTAITVTLTSSDTTEATVLTSITLQPGQLTSDPFDIVAVDDTDLDGTQSSVITARATGFADGTALLNVADDEIDIGDAAITLVIGADIIPENGTATAIVRRNTDTALPLTVTLTSSDPSQATIPETIVIPAGSVNSASFSISAVNDVLIDGDQDVVFTASAALHASGTDTVNVQDDDVPSIFVTVLGETIREEGETSTTLQITRNSDVTEPLAFDFVNSNPDRVSIATTPTEFAADQAVLTVEVTAVDDSIANGTGTATFTVTAAGHEEGSDSVDILDNDIMGLTITISPTTITENGTATATVSRNSATTAALQVAVWTRDPSEVFLQSSVTIAAGETTSPEFTITGLNDGFADGTQSVEVLASAIGHPVVVNLIEVTDVDVAEVLLTFDEDSFFENAVSTATVTRNTATTDALTVMLSNDNPSAVTIPQTVTIEAGETSATFDVVGIDNDIPDGTRTATLQAEAVGHQSSEGTIAINDNDQAGIAVADVGNPIEVTEAGTEQSVSVALTLAPSSDVTLLFSSSDSTEAIVSQQSLTFTPDNWNIAQQVTVQGVGDLLDDGDVEFDITVAVDTSISDSSFSTVDPVVLSGTNRDVLVTNLAASYSDGEFLVTNLDDSTVVFRSAASNLEFDLRGRERTLDVGSFDGLSGTVDIRHESDDVLTYDPGWNIASPVFVGTDFAHILERDSATIRIFNDAPHRNPFDRWDVNRDGTVSALDALNGINFLNTNGGAISLTNPDQGQELLPHYYDVSGDQQASAVDSLQVINRLLVLSRQGGQGEGEQAITSDLLSDQQATDQTFADETSIEFVISTAKRQSFGSVDELAHSDQIAVSVSSNESSSEASVDQAIDELLSDEGFEISLSQ